MILITGPLFQNRISDFLSLLHPGSQRTNATFPLHLPFPLDEESTRVAHGKRKEQGRLTHQMGQAIPATQAGQEGKHPASFLARGRRGRIPIRQGKVACGDEDKCHFHEAEDQSGRMISGCYEKGCNN